MSLEIFDAIVVGGGPAGLSAALVLGRCRRRVLVFDTGSPRNKVSPAMYAFPSREGEDPKLFLIAIKKELRRYGIGILKKKVVKAAKVAGRFVVTAEDGEQYRAQTLLLATGLVDHLPPVPGIEKFYGRGVYHCPYCDGWENREKPWALCATTARAAVAAAAKLRNWTDDLTVMARYARGFTHAHEELLAQNGIKVVRSLISSLKGKKGKLALIKLDDDSVMKCDALFFVSKPAQHSDLASQLNCRFTRRGHVDFNRFQQTNVEGLYVAGDMARDMQLVLIAAAEGAKAAVVINEHLIRKEWVG